MHPNQFTLRHNGRRQSRAQPTSTVIEFGRQRFQPRSHNRIPQTLTTTDPVEFARQRLAFHPDPQQQRVLRAGITRGLLNCSRQWGKSTVIAVKAVHHAFTQPNRLVVVCSPSLRQSQEFCNKALKFLQQLGVKSLNLPNGSRIIGLPANENTIRGFSAATLLLIDEAARVSDGLYAAVKPMLATTGGEMWLLSTPHGARGFFYREWMDALSSWERIRGPGADCPRILPEYLEEERRSLGELRFRQEYCCEFLADGRNAFPPPWIESAFAPWHRAGEWRIGAQFSVCVDLGQMSDPTAIAVIERWTEPTGELDRRTFQQASRKRYAVRWLERVPLGTSYVDVVDRIFALVRQWKQLGNCEVVLDASGVGGAVLDMLRSQSFTHCRLIPVVFTAGERDSFNVDRWHVPKRDLVQGLALVLESGSILVDPRLPEADALRRELQNLRWAISPSGRDTFSGGRDHDDLVMAVALGIWRGRKL
jgi:hypothetical protein